jgi:hypothetical protein
MARAHRRELTATQVARAQAINGRQTFVTNEDVFTLFLFGFHLGKAIPPCWDPYYPLQNGDHVP